MQAFLEDNMPTVIDYGTKVIGVLVVLIIAWIISGWLSRATGKALKKARIDVTLGKFLSRIVKWAVLLFAMLGCLGVFGVDVTSFAAVLAAMGFAIGLAFQGTLSNIAAGVMLLVFRPFKVGDVVEVSGCRGTVDEIGIFTTTLDTADKRRLILPNSGVFGATIENVSHHQKRRVDVAVGADYSASLDATRAALMGAASGVPDRLPEEEPIVVLTDLGASSVDWSVRVWVDAEDYWSVKEALLAAVKNALDNAGIGIPFPQMDVHVDGAAG